MLVIRRNNTHGENAHVDQKRVHGFLPLLDKLVMICLNRFCSIFPDLGFFFLGELWQVPYFQVLKSLNYVNICVV